MAGGWGVAGEAGGQWHLHTWKQNELVSYSWKQEEQLEGVQGTRTSGPGGPTAAGPRQNRPKPCPPRGTFLAPSFSAFFRASSKSST